MRHHARLTCTGLFALLALTGAATADDTFQWNAVGADTYNTICAACHQPTGVGVPGTFPPLAGHAAEILTLPGGRDYLVRLVLFGLEGEITVNGKTFNSSMPPLAETLTDAQLAAALDYVLHSFGNDKALPPGFAPFVPSDIAAARGKAMTAAEVHALRGPPAAADQQSMTVTFTSDQAARGLAAYRRACQDCHGYDLGNGEFGGAPLNGQYFARHWGNGSVVALYNYLLAKMPPDRPGKLNPQMYADLVAFLLSKNGYASGTAELPPNQDAQQHMSLKR
jgi:mono/diheme cytochrome c family protein